MGVGGMGHPLVPMGWRTGHPVVPMGEVLHISCGGWEGAFTHSTISERIPDYTLLQKSGLLKLYLLIQASLHTVYTVLP